MADRTILHCDMNSFFASVELLERPDLCERPVAVSGNPDHRHGIILAKNDIAKACGVATAETIWQARKKCPDLVLLPPHHDKYSHYSKLISKIYERYTDMVEPFSIDESWLDVTASEKLFGDGKTIADDIRTTVQSELGLTLSAGVSFNKTFAKMGSEYKKPNATTLISRDNFKEILWPLPANEFFFVGRATATKLSKYGINTIGEIATSGIEMLSSLLGKQGEMLYEYANGRDYAPVTRSNERSRIKSVGHGITFRRDLLGKEDITIATRGLADRVSARLRKYDMRAGGVKIEIKDPEFKTISKQMQLDHPGGTAQDIATAVETIIDSCWNMNEPIRLLTITAINLVASDENEQVCMFEDMKDDRNDMLAGAMDEIRTRYGRGAINFGSLLNNDLGIDIEDHSEE